MSLGISFCEELLALPWYIPNNLSMLRAEDRVTVRVGTAVEVVQTTALHENRIDVFVL